MCSEKVSSSQLSLMHNVCVLVYGRLSCQHVSVSAHAKHSNIILYCITVMYTLKSTMPVNLETKA